MRRRDRWSGARPHAAAAVAAILLFLPMSSLAQEKSANDRAKIDARRGFLAPQLDVADDGTVFMLWTHPLAQGHDLYVSSRGADGLFGSAERVNDRPGSVRYLAFDEDRPAIATGPGGILAVGWRDLDGNVRVATSPSGRAFQPSIVVNQKKGRPERGFISLAYDPQGTLHVAWIDARSAPKDMEEPAQIYYARYVPGRDVHEIDLTGKATKSVCGCCRPQIYADRHGLNILYRNVDEKGFRDIHRMRGSLGGEFQSPERLGPARWKIEGCPSMGPIYDGSVALWRDAADGTQRILAFIDGMSRPEVVIGASAQWAPTASPRWIAGAPSGDSMALIPGDPSGLVVSRRGGRWVILSDQVPQWCRAAAWIDGQILLVGDHYGELRQEALRLAAGR